MKVLDLFSGIGGFSLGLERAGMETVAFCECEEFPVKILNKHWPDVPVYSDVKELTYDRLKKDGIVAHSPSAGLEGEQREKPEGGRKRLANSSENRVDLVCGGFPCQPFSVAGQQRAQDDDRHLWPQIVRILREFAEAGNPIPYCLFENVAGIVNLALDECITDLEALGYACRVFCIPACAVGAPHRRDRIWIVAHREGKSQRARFCEGESRRQRGTRLGNARSVVADSDDQGLQGPMPWREVSGRHKANGHAGQGSGPRRGNERPTERGLGGEIDGIPAWLDGTWEHGTPRVTNGQKDRANRLKALGNAVVPQVVEVIGRAIMEARHASA